jgi:hypothetical protein
VGGRPRRGRGPDFFGILPASFSARRKSISMWALRLRRSSAAQCAKASWTAGSIRSRICLRSLTDYLVKRPGVHDGRRWLVATENHEQIAHHGCFALFVEFHDAALGDAIESKFDHSHCAVHDG